MNQPPPSIYEHKRQARYFEKLVERGFPASAFLFHGPGGVGKKTFATHLIAGLFCPQKSAFGCGVCTYCLEIFNCRHPDVHLLPLVGGGKEIGVADVRSLKQSLSLSPFAGSWRAAVIEGAENLTAEAQSAFLKILEEPPVRTLFFLITPYPHVLFDTVRSRLIPISFGDTAGSVTGHISATNLQDFFKKDIWDQFKFVDALAEKGDSAAEEFLRNLVIEARREFLNGADFLSGPEKIRSLLDLYAMFRGTSVNRRLILDSALLTVKGI